MPPRLTRFRTPALIAACVAPAAVVGVVFAPAGSAVATARNVVLGGRNTTTATTTITDSLSRPWTVKIGVDNRRITIGRFADEDEAAMAYDRAALELWGEYACLNFPGPGQRGAVA